MEYQNKVKHCLALLKSQVKSKSIPYQQLADQLDVSVLTIKRQLNGSDLSMAKLLALCDAAGISFVDIWQSVEERKPAHTVFTAEQDSAFCRYPHLFHYFIALFQQKKSASELQRTWQLTPASTHVYLRKLEQLALINLSVTGEVTFLVNEPLGFGPGSQFVKNDLKNALVEISKRVGPDCLDDVFVIAKPLVLSDELRQKMYTELMEVVSRYAELSERYFIESAFEPYQLVFCDYKMQKEGPLPDIVNVTRLD